MTKEKIPICKIYCCGSGKEKRKKVLSLGTLILDEII